MSFSEWKEFKLGELIESISIKHNFNKEKLIFLNTSDVLDGKVLHSNYSEVAGMPGQAKKSIEKNDILFSEIRPKNKRFAYIDFNSEDYVVSTKLMVLRKKSHLIDNSFLYKYLTSDKMLNYLQVMAEGRSGTFPQITFSELKNIEIKLPPLKEQKIIGKILSDIDSKIDVNNKINNKLSELMSSIYKKRFLINAELKTEAILLSNLCDFQEGYVNPPQGKAEYFDGDVKWLRAVDINESYIINTSRTLTKEGFESAKKSALLFQPNTIAITKSGTIGRLGIIGDYMCGNRATINIKPKNLYWTQYIYYYLKSRQSEFNNLAVGSVQKNLYVSILENLVIQKPQNSEIDEFAKIVNPMAEKLLSNVKENISLENLRDILVPKLMNGEIELNNFNFDNK